MSNLPNHDYRPICSNCVCFDGKFCINKSLFEKVKKRSTCDINKFKPKKIKKWNNNGL